MLTNSSKRERKRSHWLKSSEPPGESSDGQRVSPSLPQPFSVSGKFLPGLEGFESTNKCTVWMAIVKREDNFPFNFDSCLSGAQFTEKKNEANLPLSFSMECVWEL